MIFVWFMGTALIFLSGYIANTAINDKTTNSPVGEYRTKGVNL